MIIALRFSCDQAKKKSFRGWPSIERSLTEEKEPGVRRELPSARILRTALNWPEVNGSLSLILAGKVPSDHRLMAVSIADGSRLNSNRLPAGDKRNRAL